MALKPLSRDDNLGINECVASDLDAQDQGSGMTGRLRAAMLDQIYGHLTGSGESRPLRRTTRNDAYP